MKLKVTTTIVSLVAAGAMAMPAAMGAEAEPTAPALFDEAAPAATTIAWYWEPQFSQPVSDPTTGADIAVIELPNPWCPNFQVVGSIEQACHEGRLPIEVINGDYESPDKVSAVAFDLSLVPIGSEVSSFMVQFREAPADETPPSYNHTDKELVACFVDDFFGEGVARQYKERPKFTCGDTSPRGVRKEVQEGGETAAVWDFDLTAHAQTWVEAGSPVAGILIAPVKPQSPPPSPADDWRVVLAGPVAPNGIVTSLTYTPPKIDSGETGTGGDTGGDFSGAFDSGGGFDTGSTTIGSDTTDTGADTGAPATDDGASPEPQPTALDPQATGDTLPQPEEGLPWYVWASVLAGLIAFSLVRSVVVEKATGVRPDGVLAQITALNPNRERTEQVAGPAASAGIWVGVKQAFASTGSGIRRTFGRLGRGAK